MFPGLLPRAVRVANNKATLYLIDPPNDKWSATGARTLESKVPSSTEFHQNEAGTKRNRWTAVSDFYAKERFEDQEAHHAIFLRVNERTWHKGKDRIPTQTRFGCYIHGRLKTKQGYLQLTSNKPGARNTKAQKLIHFNLKEDPFAHPDRWYRVQIHEEQRYEDDKWVTYWMAEVWRLAQGNLAVRQLGDSGWESEVTIKNSYGVDIPELSGSKIMIGAGPGTAGTVQVSRVATNHWTYTD